MSEFIMLQMFMVNDFYHNSHLRRKSKGFIPARGWSLLGGTLHGWGWVCVEIWMGSWPPPLASHFIGRGLEGEDLTHREGTGW